ncbi:hypothetical protein CTA1_7296 [Colletotrichum tanaceti]|uniref:Uncharacterized protein n=1 Tax=Colletotrichum tanaceti TaxID=1306861 RepID=A0A4U6X0D4_9PEZI|nr:hypothetical protein CTA1_7296 [Colletotrichum tanaceti]
MAVVLRRAPGRHRRPGLFPGADRRQSRSSGGRSSRACRRSSFVDHRFLGKGGRSPRVAWLTVVMRRCVEAACMKFSRWLSRIKGDNKACCCKSTKPTRSFLCASNREVDRRRRL